MVKVPFARKSRKDRGLARIGLVATIRSIGADKWQLAKIMICTLAESVLSALIPISFGMMLSNQNHISLFIHVMILAGQLLMSSLFWVLMKAQIAAMLGSINDQLYAAIRDTSPEYLEEVARKEARLHSSQLRLLASMIGSDIMHVANSLFIVGANVLGIGIAFGAKFMIIILAGSLISMLAQFPVIWVNRFISLQEKANDGLFNNQFDSLTEELYLLQEAGATHWKKRLTDEALQANYDLFRRTEPLRGLVTGISQVVPIATMVVIIVSMAFEAKMSAELIASLYGYILVIVPATSIATQVLLRIAENTGTFRHLGLVLRSPQRPEGEQTLNGIKKLIVSASLTFLFMNGGGLFTERGIARKEITFNKEGFYVLVGPSGAGKSQLMGVLARRLDNIAGDIRWEGSYWLLTEANEQVRVSETPLAAFGQYVHTCPQTPEWVDGLTKGPFMPGTVEQNIGIQGLKSGQIPPGLERFIQQAAAAVGLDDKLKQPVSTLSGGEKARVSIARGLVGCMLHPNSVLLLDEAVSALNKALALRLIPRIRLLQREYGFTVIMVSHADYANPSDSHALVFWKSKDGVPQGIVERGPVRWLRLIPWSFYNRVNERGVIARILNRL